ncbi:hypothetical protein JCM11641_002006 [Rhodosporidiobolus odoratus]
MTSQTSPTKPVERQWLRDVVRAVLGTVLFHRVVGNVLPTQVDVLGVSFPAIANQEIEDLVTARTELLLQVLLNGVAPPEGRKAKLYVSFYPIPLPHLPSSSRNRTTNTSTTSAARPSSRSLPYSASPTRGSLRRPASLAQAAPAAVTSALGWFSASARAALSSAAGSSDTGPVHVDDGNAKEGREEGQEEELKLLEKLEAEGVSPWEGWCIELEVLGEDTRRNRGDAEERLRSQLNDFLLRSLDFSMQNTAHVPPITTADLQAFGALILVDPPTPPFSVPRATIDAVQSFPVLHKHLATARSGSEGQSAGVGALW